MQSQPKWISFSIFHELMFEKVIIELIKPILEELKKKKYLESYFFIRYWEEGSHIRFRILPKKSRKRSEIIEIISAATRKYFANLRQNIEYSLKLEDYIPETLRYGGSEMIAIAEKYFEFSTKAVINIIDANYNSWDYRIALSHAIQMHLYFAKYFFSTHNDRIAFFRKIHSNWLHCSIKLDQDGKITQSETNKINMLFEKSYKNQKQQLQKLSEVVYFEDDLNDWTRNWISECNYISNSFSNIKSNTEDLHFVYDSLIHMTNNRLGIFLRDEAFIAFLLFNILETLEEKYN